MSKKKLFFYCLMFHILFQNSLYTSQITTLNPAYGLFVSNNPNISYYVPLIPVHPSWLQSSTLIISGAPVATQLVVPNPTYTIFQSDNPEIVFYVPIIEINTNQFTTNSIIIRNTPNADNQIAIENPRLPTTTIPTNHGREHIRSQPARTNAANIGNPTVVNNPIIPTPRAFPINNQTNTNSVSCTCNKRPIVCAFLCTPKSSTE